ncbi:20441_t:CDS:2, partial [Rhizophagus irregularis]
RRFEMEVQELSPEIEIINNAYTELKESEKFKRLLKTILVFGNFMNDSTFRGNAIGYKLDVLLKIRDTKAVENNSKGTLTLLHYLAATLEETQSDLLTFMDDLPHLEAAARISVITLIASVNELTNGIDSIKEEIDNMKNLQIKQQNDYFVKIMEEFVKKAESTILDMQDTTQNLEENLKQLLIYYCEDPVATKPEEFFGMIVSFGSSLIKARQENEEVRKKIEKTAARRPSEVPSLASSLNSLSLSVKGDFDETIRGLRSGLKPNRSRPVSKVFSDVETNSPRPSSRIFNNASRPSSRMFNATSRPSSRILSNVSRPSSRIFTNSRPSSRVYTDKL